MHPKQEFFVECLALSMKDALFDFEKLLAETFWSCKIYNNNEQSIYLLHHKDLSENAEEYFWLHVRQDCR